MQKEKAISNLAVFLLQNKTDVISLINRLRISSLPLNASIVNVNEVVIDNSSNKELESGLLKIANNGYSGFVCGGVCIAIVAGIIVVTAGVAVQQDIRRNKKMREEILYSNGEDGLILPDGTAYIGYYHAMLDGTLMTGKYHGKGKDIVLTEIYD